MSTSFNAPREYAAFVESFTSAPKASLSSSYPTESDSFYVESFDLAFECNAVPAYALGTLEVPAPSTSNIAQPIPTSLLTLLHPTLLSSFLDSAPSAFSPSLSLASGSGMDSHLSTVAAVIGVSKELYWAELGGVQVSSVNTGGNGGREKERESARKLLVTLLSHVGVYFPFGADELEQRSKAAEAQLQTLNLTFASLVSLLVLSIPEVMPQRRRGKETKSKGKSTGEMSARIETMVERVCEWVIEVLHGEVSINESLHTSEH